jgi:hypothetical protein
MTANYIAKVVESLYNKIDIDKMSEGFDKIKQHNHNGTTTDEWTNRRIAGRSYFRWCKSIGVLESYCKINFETFEETELVYKWAKHICKYRNDLYNEWRAFGGHITFNQWLKNRQ